LKNSSALARQGSAQEQRSKNDPKVIRIRPHAEVLVVPKVYAAIISFGVGKRLKFDLFCRLLGIQFFQELTGIRIDGPIGVIGPRKDPRFGFVNGHTAKKTLHLQGIWDFR
jgi:hypothetical protein